MIKLKKIYFDIPITIQLDIELIDDTQWTVDNRIENSISVLHHYKSTMSNIYTAYYTNRFITKYQIPK